MEARCGSRYLIAGVPVVVYRPGAPPGTEADSVLALLPLVWPLDVHTVRPCAQPPRNAPQNSAREGGRSCAEGGIS